MRHYLTFKLATALSITLIGLFASFHGVVIAGIVLGDYVPLEFLWGGRFESRTQLLTFEFVSLLVLLACLAIVLIRSGMFGSRRWVRATTGALWVLCVLFALNTVGNLLAKTTFEKSLAVVTAALAVSCWRMAVEKYAPNTDGGNAGK